MAEDIAATLTANGWPCRAFPTWLIKDVNDLFRAKRTPFILNMNLIPAYEVNATTIRGKDSFQEKIIFYRAWEKYRGVPVVNILIDQAFHHINAIGKYLPWPDGMALATLEQSDLSWLENLGIARGRMIHLPWGGPAPDPKPKPFGKRTHDVIFHGGLEPLESKADFSARCMSLGVPEACGEGLLRAAEQVVEESAGVERAFRAAMEAAGADPARFGTTQVALMLYLIDRRARTIRRHGFLSAFVDVPVQFFGQYPPDFQRRFSRAVFHREKTFREIIEITRDARMSLCESINWRDNVHLRLTYSIPYGCLAVAEKNPHLERDFTDMKNIVFSSYPHGNTAEKVESILANRRLGQEMVDAAMPIYNSRYTWLETVKLLAPFLPPPGAVVPPPSAEKKAAKSKMARSKSARIKSAPRARSRRGRRPGSRR